MPEVGFGAASVLSGYTDNYVQSGGIGWAAGRANAAGRTPIRPVALYGFASGRGGARSCVMSLGPASTSAFGIGSAGAAAATGWIGCSSPLVYGGSATFTIDINGSSYFGRGGGGTSVDSYGTSFAGMLAGYYRYTESPTAPVSLALSLTGTYGQVGVSFSAPVDNGGTGITGYDIEYWNTSAPGTIYHAAVAGSSFINSLAAGTWAFRVAAKNDITNSDSTTGVYSATQTITVPSTGKIWDGSAYVQPTVRVWNGTTWVQGFIKVWDGAAWVPAL